MSLHKWGLAVILSLVIAFAMGPSPSKPELSTELPHLEFTGEDLDIEITRQEREVGHLKEDNQARIVWYDSAKRATPYSVVYLHGFSASQGEGDPVISPICRLKIPCCCFTSGGSCRTSIRMGRHGTAAGSMRMYWRTS